MKMIYLIGSTLAQSLLLNGCSTTINTGNSNPPKVTTPVSTSESSPSTEEIVQAEKTTTNAVLTIEKEGYLNIANAIHLEKWIVTEPTLTESQIKEISN